MKKKCLLVKQTKHTYSYEIMQSLEYCALYQQNTCLRILILYLQYKNHVPLNKWAFFPLCIYLYWFLFFSKCNKTLCFFFFFSLKNCHDVKRKIECDSTLLLEEMDLFAGMDSWTLLGTFSLGQLFCLSWNLKKIMISFKELRCYIGVHLMVDD